MGIEKASQQVAELSEEAVKLLEGLNKKNEFLLPGEGAGGTQEVKEGYK